MCRITDADLIYGLQLALNDPKLAPETRQRLQNLIDRWEAQQRQPEPDAAKPKAREWKNERYCLNVLAQIADAERRKQVADAYIAHLAAYGGNTDYIWSDGKRDAERETTEHSIHPY